jgi:hypothetical protein
MFLSFTDSVNLLEEVTENFISSPTTYRTTAVVHRISSQTYKISLFDSGVKTEALLKYFLSAYISYLK